MDHGITSALIGAGAALLVVLVTAAVAVTQLRHDREQRAKDRALQAKRDLLIDALKSAIIAMRSGSDLVRQEVDINAVSAKFTNAIAAMNAASAVASLEVVARGKDLVATMGKQYMTAMAVRSTLAPDLMPEQLVDFALDVIEKQKEFQQPFALLVAAVRRDLLIEGADDEAVAKALWMNVDEIGEHARKTFKDLLGRI